MRSTACPDSAAASKKTPVELARHAAEPGIDPPSMRTRTAEPPVRHVAGVHAPILVAEHEIVVVPGGTRGELFRGLTFPMRHARGHGASGQDEVPLRLGRLDISEHGGCRNRSARSGSTGGGRVVWMFSNARLEFWANLRVFGSWA